VRSRDLNSVSARKTQSGSYEDLKAESAEDRKNRPIGYFSWICMNHDDVGGYCIKYGTAAVVVCALFNGRPYNPENTRILDSPDFLVMGEMKKRITIVARKIGERDERSTGGLTWAATG
jgi:hypothetical protein